MEEDYREDHLDKVIEKAKKRIERNYKTAVPQFYDGRLQLLLPLCFKTEEKADLALTVELEKNVYVAQTVLPIDWAYRNARLIAPPDREWLDPL